MTAVNGTVPGRRLGRAGKRPPRTGPRVGRPSGRRRPGQPPSRRPPRPRAALLPGSKGSKSLRRRKASSPPSAPGAATPASRTAQSPAGAMMNLACRSAPGTYVKHGAVLLFLARHAARRGVRLRQHWPKTAQSCWGWDEYGQATPPAGEFASVSAGYGHTCGMMRDGSVACWGYDGEGHAARRGVRLRQRRHCHTCGVSRLWGWDGPGHAARRRVRLGQKPTPVAGRRSRLLDTLGQSTPTDGEFASVSAGSSHTCGMMRDDSVHLASPRSLGQRRRCPHLRDRDGAVACWGDDRTGRATPPDGEFASVSAGGVHTCGVKRDGSVACWGQATPPAGEFASVSAGGLHTCEAGWRRRLLG